MSLCFAGFLLFAQWFFCLFVFPYLFISLFSPSHSCSFLDTFHFLSGVSGGDTMRSYTVILLSCMLLTPLEKALVLTHPVCVYMNLYFIYCLMS